MHEMSKPIFWRKIRKYFKMSSPENVYIFVYINKFGFLVSGENVDRLIGNKIPFCYVEARVGLTWIYSEAKQFG